MKHSRATSGCSILGLTLMTLCLPTVAFGACQDVRDRIAQNIESNGVEPMGYSLEVIPTADADQAQGQIVGHCENNQYQIVYKRHYRNSSAETMEDTSADENEIDGTSSSASSSTPSDVSSENSITSEMTSSKTPDEATRTSRAAETESSGSAPSHQDDASDNRRIQTSEMPVGADPQ